ncbi:MAG: 5-formyltetrahydrofolate cyclo-ligase [Vulcanibacillus sp.]
MLIEKYNKKKVELRKKLINERNNLNTNKIELLSKIISDKIMDSNYFKKASNVLVYIPFRNEVDIRDVIEKAWQLNKQVIVPKTNLIEKKMYPYLINSWEELELGNYQLLEPIVDKKMPFPISNIEVVLIPGVVFDRNGYRLGYGGGFYDRFFADCLTPIYKIGIAYDFQIIDHLPVLKHDYPVDEIITEEQKIIITGKSKKLY